MINNDEYSYYDTDRLLTEFLGATDNLSTRVQALDTMYSRAYHYRTHLGGTRPLDENITLLEVVALSPLDKIDHLNAVLSKVSKSHPMVSLLKLHPVHAFFRALLKGNVAIANRLLDLQVVQDMASTINVTSKTARDFINRIRELRRFPKSNLHGLNQGNVALIMAARLGNTEIFNRLCALESFKDQLPKSAVLAFISATTRYDGRLIEDSLLNRDIINQLLAIPTVFAYAYTRSLELGHLTEAFQAARLKALHDDSDAVLNMKDSDAILCIYFILIMIDNKCENALSEITFLLDIDRVQSHVHEPISIPGDNYDEFTLLRLSLLYKNYDVAKLLMHKSTDVLSIAEQYQYYGYSTLRSHSPNFFVVSSPNTLPFSSGSDLSLMTTAAATDDSTVDEFTGCASAIDF